jgi:hypothetical protein
MSSTLLKEASKIANNVEDKSYNIKDPNVESLFRKLKDNLELYDDNTINKLEDELSDNPNKIPLISLLLLKLSSKKYPRGNKEQVIEDYAKKIKSRTARSRSPKKSPRSSRSPRSPKKSSPQPAAKASILPMEFTRQVAQGVDANKTVLDREAKIKIASLLENSGLNVISTFNLITEHIVGKKFNPVDDKKIFDDLNKLKSLVSSSDKIDRDAFDMTNVVEELPRVGSPKSASV